MMSNDFLVLDCTVRDGGYINDWNFPVEMVKAMYQASSEAGTDIFEIGFLDKDTTKPIWRCCTSELVHQVRDGGKTRISAMLEADTVGMKLGTPKETGIDILRIALNRNMIESSLPNLSQYKKDGYMVFIQMMGITGYKDIDILKTMAIIEKTGIVDYVNIGDSYGSLLPDETGRIISLMKKNTSLKVGLHPHNNMQMGMANILAAIHAGADIVDGSMYGMGRGGGNAPLELILAYFGKNFPQRFNVLPALEFIDRNMIKLMDEYNWGYSLGGVLSGVYECHPYYTSKLLDTREYTIGQILSTVQIVNDSDVIGFSSQLLKTIVENGFVKDKVQLENSVRRFVDENKNRVTYFNRHEGQNFLILGNGPTLKSQQKEIEKYIQTSKSIVMGANNLGEMFQPNYHAFNNQRRFEQFVKTVSSDSMLLLGPGIVAKNQLSECEEIVCYNSSSTDVFIKDGVITSNCRSISLLMAAVAIVMGAKSICFAGMDGYLGEEEFMFYDEQESKNPQDILDKHYENERYLKQIIDCAKMNGCSTVEFLTPTTYTLS